jgi:thiamine-monophosphate kinase
LIDLKARLSEIGERALLRHLRSRIPAGPGVTIGVGDDAAGVETTTLTLVTTDSMVEGVHFKREWSPPHLLGRKALSINLSDIAAMAGVSRHAVVSLCLPPDLPVAFIDELYDGLLERAAESNVNIVGGNVSSTSGPIVIDITLLGQGGERLLRRSGAVPGDLVVVTGGLGAAAAGLRLLAQGARLSADGGLAATGIWTDSSREAVRHCLRAQLDPTPPLALGRALVEEDMAHAAIDLSDGLSSDLRLLCEESGLAARISPDMLPIDPHAAGLSRAQGDEGLHLALHGGEDYQLLAAVPRERYADVAGLGQVWNIPITAVGEFIEGAPEVLIERGGTVEPLPPSAHEHFRSGPPRVE